MFKKLKIFLIAILMIPCVFMMSACNFFKKKDPSLTTAQKNEAFGKLKSIVSEDYSEKSATKTVTSTSNQSTTLGSIDFSKSTIDTTMQEQVRQGLSSEMAGSTYRKVEIAYNNDGTAYNIRTEGESAEDATEAASVYFAKNGQQITKYERRFSDWTNEFHYSAEHVSAEHGKFESVENSLDLLDGLKESAIESADFSEFVTNMGNEYLEMYDEETKEKIDLDIDLTEEKGVYTISGTCTMDKVTMSMEGMSITADGAVQYTLKFTETDLVEYSLDTELELTTEMPATMFGATGSIEFNMTQEGQDKVVFEDKFDSSKMPTDFSDFEAEVEEISNAYASVEFYINGYEYTDDHFDFAEEYDISENDYHFVDLSELTWYTDEACTTPLSGTTITAKSFETIKLYAKDFAIPSGSAAIIEIYDEDSSVDYVDLSWQETIDFYDYQFEYYNIYVTIDNGTRTLQTEESITLEEGKTYKVEYVYKDSE